MTSKPKRTTLAEREAANLQAVPAPVDNDAPAAEPPARPAARQHKSPSPTEPETVKVEYPGIQNWKPVSARVHPRVRASFNSRVNQKKLETGGGAREVMTEALNAYFLTIPPFDDYTRELHERAEAEAAAAKRRR